MKRYKLSLSSNPSFNTVTGLTNTTFNPTNYVENRMATEAQISDLYNRIVEQEQRRDNCCRDIIVWEAHVQIVRMNTLNINSSNILTGGGAVISDFDENVSVGTMRRGKNYTVTFPLKWDDNLYVKRNAIANGASNCIHATSYSPGTPDFKTIVNYRIVEDNTLKIANCSATNSNYARFWYGAGIRSLSSAQLNNNDEGHHINFENKWGSFVHDIKDDGTVTITDHRRNTNFNVIRFYTQWILRRTANNQMIPDP